MNALRIIVVSGATLLVPLTASAAKTFLGPATWVHIASATPGTAGTQDVWKSSSAPTAEVLAMMSDATTSYDGVLAAVRANVASGGIKLGLDRDTTCNGSRAHTFELSFGPDGKKTLVNQTIIADGDGTTRITYTRSDGKPFSDEVKSAIGAYCGP